MKNIETYKARLESEQCKLDKIKYDMLAEIAHAAHKAGLRAGKRSMRHLRNIQLLTRIIEDHTIQIEIEDMTFVRTVMDELNK